MTLSHADLARLYDEHAGALYAFLLSFTAQEADARDLLQETFVKLTGRPNRLAQARDELAFLLQTCCRLGVDWTRRHRVRTRQFGTMGIAKQLQQHTQQLEQVQAKWTEDEFRRNLQVKFTGPPFADTDENCETLSSCYGLRFRVSRENTHEALRFAGEFVSTHQIILADLAKYDLDFNPGTVRIDLKLTDADSVKAEQATSKEFQWTVLIPRHGATNNDTVEGSVKAALTCVLQILRSLSVMSGKDLLRHASEWSLRTTDHSFTARRFPELIAFFPPRGLFGSPARRTASTIKPADWFPRESPELPWREIIHPMFDEADQLRMIQQSYDVTAAGLCCTLPLLRQDLGFNNAVAVLRQQGWKDWHILASILNAVVFYRVDRRTRPNTDPQKWAQEVLRELYDPDSPSKPTVPLKLLTLENLEGGIFASILSVLVNLSLEIDPGRMEVEGPHR